MPPGAWCFPASSAVLLGIYSTFVMTGGCGVGGDDDDIGTETPRTISLVPFYSVFTVLSCGGPSYMMMVSKHHASSVGFPDSGGVGE